MNFNSDLAAIHAYLCADGYVTINPESRKIKYYKIGLRNKNLGLLTDFQNRFLKHFGVMPHLYPGERCELGSKKINTYLTNRFGSFYSYEWKMPENLNVGLKKIWIRTYFDCEGWVFCKRKQNRHLGADCVNEKALNQVKRELESLGIKIIKKVVKNGKMFRILIYGKENLMKFQSEINFNHPEKRLKLQEVVSDFVNYKWVIKENPQSIRELMLEKAKIKKPYVTRIVSKEEENLIILKNYLNSLFGVDYIKINKRINGLGTIYFELSINKRDEVKKLVKHNLINASELNKINWRE